MKKAFTLVELLVVIAIISLLMSILMPALAAARQQAKQLVCQSNIRQLVLANVGYSTENDGFYVPAASDMLKPNGGQHRWHGIRQSTDEDFDPLKGPLISYLADGKVKQCPSKKDFFKSTDWNPSFEKGGGGFGYNMVYIGSRLGQGGNYRDKESYIRTTRATEVQKPADTLMFADTAFLNNQGQVIEYSFAEPRYPLYDGIADTSSPLQPTIHFRHRNTADIGWTDGHIGTKKMADLNDPAFTQTSAMQIGWFDPADNNPFDLQ